MRRTRLLLHLLLGAALVLGLAACSSGHAASSATGGTPAPRVGSATTGASARATTTTAAPQLVAATPAITAALHAKGHSNAYATCVITHVGLQFRSTQLAFAIAVLSLQNATDQQLQAAVAATGISDDDKADIPDDLHAIADTCASTEAPKT